MRLRAFALPEVRRVIRRHYSRSLRPRIGRGTGGWQVCWPDCVCRCEDRRLPIPLLSVSQEFLIVAGLVVLNGLLAMAEVATLSVRRSNLQKLAVAGSRRAHARLLLSGSLWQFLAVIRLGITIVAVSAGVVAGDRFVPWLATVYVEATGSEKLAEEFAVVGVVAGLALISFVFGEILLKRLALGRPERAAFLLVRPINLWFRLSGPFVAMLTRAVDAILGGMGMTRPGENRISEDELTALVELGLRQGVFQKAEKEMVESVLALDRMSVMTIMTPRPRTVWLDLTDPDEVNWRKIVASGHSYFPVCDGAPDRLVGMLSVKALWANSAAGFDTPMRDLLFKPLFVPESTTGIEVLETFKRAGRRVALVQDEFGTVSGVVTLIDVLESIVGDLPERGKPRGPVARRTDDDTWLVDATLPLADLREAIGVGMLANEEKADFQTLGGFVLTGLGRIPRVGDVFVASGFSWEVVSMDRFRVDRVRVKRLPGVEKTGSDGNAAG